MSSLPAKRPEVIVSSHEECGHAHGHDGQVHVDLDSPRGWRLVYKVQQLLGFRRYPILYSSRAPRLFSRKRIVVVGVMLFASILAASLLGAVVHAADSSGPVVDLGYSKYRGSKLASGISQWLGMRYAAPPIGHLRFRDSEDPLVTKGILPATERGPTCIGTDVAVAGNGFEEDCLYVDVFAPAGAKNLPVYVFIQGGGFNRNSNANYSGAGLIQASNNNIVVVTFGYRVGLYGFLASKEVVADGDLNTGLKDQRRLFKWVQKNIAKFGGNPRHVTIGGASAGAASVDLHLTAYGGRNDNLFHATAAQSQSFGVQFTVEESQYQYDHLIKDVKCNSTTDSLGCLRSKTSQQLQDASSKGNYVAPGATGPPIFMYSNVIDGDFTPDYTYNLFAQGKFVKLPAIWGADTNDGTVFVNKSADSFESVNNFLQNQFPNVTDAQLAQINKYYPRGAQFPPRGEYFTSLAQAYGDIRYKCPGVYISARYSDAGVANWNYRYDVVEDPTTGDGAYHTVEINPIWGPENIPGTGPASYEPGGVNVNMIPEIQGYWTSFIRSYDPNAHRARGSAKWEQFTASKHNRLLLLTNATAMETIAGDEQEHCAYLSSIGPSLGQ